MAYDNFSNILSSIKRQSAAVSGRPSSGGTVSGVLAGVAAGADSRVANKRNLEMQSRQADIQQQGQDLNVQRFAEEKRQSDIELQMAHEAAMRNTNASRSQSLSQGLSTAGSLAAMKYLGGAKAFTAVPSVSISTVGSGGAAAGGSATAAAGSGAAATSGTSTAGGGLSMGVATPVAFAAYAALMTGMALSARSQRNSRRAENQAIDSLGGETDNPEQNRRYAENRQREYADVYARMGQAYPGYAQPAMPTDFYKIAPLDVGKNRMLYGTDFEPPPELREQARLNWKAQQTSG